MHGQGTLRWASGERYDGEWVEGEEDGLGVFTWRDGTTYDGFWQSGKKHGIGVGPKTVLSALNLLGVLLGGLGSLKMRCIARLMLCMVLCINDMG